MAAPHEVAKLAFDLWTGSPIVGGPSRDLLTSPGAGQRIFMGPDGDCPPSGGSVHWARRGSHSSGAIGVV
jgi:hypothetical protein